MNYDIGTGIFIALIACVLLLAAWLAGGDEARGECRDLGAIVVDGDLWTCTPPEQPHPPGGGGDSQ